MDNEWDGEGQTEHRGIHTDSDGQPGETWSRLRQFDPRTKSIDTSDHSYFTGADSVN